MATILTGIRSNSVLTLGNYLGALLPMVRLANEHSKEYQVNIFVPDLHSIISEVDGDLRENTIRTLKYWLAAGLELNENVHIYRQSYVPAHSELCWILNCVATMGETSRMIQYKEKSKGQESCNVGIFDYPILMAADILLYSAEFIPLGEDQFQHIELTRNIAMRFNNKYGEIFTVPAKTSDQVKFMEVDTAIRIRDLLNPEKKMSKSTVAEGSKIMLDDAPEKAAKKIMSATTDSLGKVKFDMFNQPGVSNLLQIEALVTNTPLSEVIAEWNGETHYGELKKKVAESVSTMLSEFQGRLAEISDDEVYRLLEEGEKYANEIANAKLLEVQKAVGLR
ncbi:tryptophan--tRNA ligase [Candidatus Saccharibacteria bacterium]|nr:tryptophan--tRNA ligase [Candidatus Saccharibacteria bacterium]MBR3253565.1 tryptophan--tRNA ligase [Candidatus Saccharibacteria bacterium]